MQNNDKEIYKTYFKEKFKKNEINNLIIINLVNKNRTYFSEIYCFMLCYGMR